MIGSFFHPSIEYNLVHTSRIKTKTDNTVQFQSIIDAYAILVDSFSMSNLTDEIRQSDPHQLCDHVESHALFKSHRNRIHPFSSKYSRWK
jgi:hypothetical protein